MPLLIFALLAITLYGVGCASGGGRTIEGTDDVIWEGGNDACIKCAHQYAREVLGEAITKQLSGFLVAVRSEKVWFNDELQMDVSGLCYSDHIEVGADMIALVHEYLEHFNFGYHSDPKTALAKSLLQLGDRYKILLPSKCPCCYSSGVNNANLPSSS